MRLALRLALALGLTWLAGCDDGQPVVTRTEGPRILAPYEQGGWPEYLDRLDLAPARDYVVLAYVPPAHPIDLSTPERARRTLARMIFGLLDAMEAGTTIGHLIVGWQCGGRRGMTSMTGEQDATGQKMLLSGWGVTPVFSAFLDGALVGLETFPPAQHRALLEGRGVVVASEVSRADCERARREVAEFATHEEAPHETYSLLARPALDEGGGCLSFALHVAGQAGVMPRLKALARRDVELRAVQLGTGDRLPEGVVPYRAPDGLHPEAPVNWLTLISTPWTRGPVIDTVRIPDGEAIMAAMVWARIGTAPKADWRYSRIMSRDDPVIGPAAAYGLRWAYGYPNRRIADPDGVSALVLER